jgi:hypothetical protein
MSRERQLSGTVAIDKSYIGGSPRQGADRPRFSGGRKDNCASAGYKCGWAASKDPTRMEHFGALSRQSFRSRLWCKPATRGHAYRTRCAAFRLRVLRSRFRAQFRPEHADATGRTVLCGCGAIMTDWTNSKRSAGGQQHGAPPPGHRQISGVAETPDSGPVSDNRYGNLRHASIRRT